MVVDDVAAIARLDEAARLAWPELRLDAERFAAFVRERVPSRAAMPPISMAPISTSLAPVCVEIPVPSPRSKRATSSRFPCSWPASSAPRRSSRRCGSCCAPSCWWRRPASAPSSPTTPAAARSVVGYAWSRCASTPPISGAGQPALASLDEVGAEQLLCTVDPELTILKQRYRPAFDEAVRAAFAGLSAKERLLFRMHFIDGLNIDGRSAASSPRCIARPSRAGSPWLATACKRAGHGRAR